MVKTLAQGLKLQYRPVEVLPPALRLALQALTEREQAPVSPAVKGTSSAAATSV